MKLIIILTLLIPSTVQAAFIPLSLEEKCNRADLIVQGTVVSVARVMPEDSERSMNDAPGYYFGPYSVAVVKIISCWKQAAPLQSAFIESKIHRPALPMYIMVPCDYHFSESLSDLTAKVDYVLFLESLGWNFYHPVDPGSTHVVYEQRVRTFGMNHPVRDEEKFQKDSIPLEEFKSRIATLVKQRKG